MERDHLPPIRDVPDETRNELAGRAARSGKSLQEFLRSALIDNCVRSRGVVNVSIGQAAPRMRASEITGPCR